MVKNQSKNSQNSTNQRKRNNEELLEELEHELNIYDESGGQRFPDLWKVLDLAKRLGIPAPEIKPIQARDFNLTGGQHYFVMEDVKKRSIKCISCPITHGHLLEPHRLIRYHLKKGVIYLDGKALNKAPKNPGLDIAEREVS